MASFPEFSTARLRLRPFLAGDVSARHRYQGLPEVSRFLYRPPLTRDQVAVSVWDGVTPHRFRCDGDRLLLAVEEPGGEVAGEVVLTLVNAAAGQGEIGWVFDPAFAGRGFATEAARGLAGWGFSRGLHRIFARLDVLNTASARVCERLGMRREAHLVENDRDGDRWGSEYVYAFLAREFGAA
ncbi:RimJ/RimL family protein N-acetyltransferase [Stackebrandtia albiflava]|uniref:RimJ/RimL family protein N-acetyltransferase n=1 Tax=Stackebrandtia albiflava TaxID=406432 RepID=A0A562V488_9ACTN|nr:GNAT family protein [Stackebrandtia albiflava]TWJ12638.1 RimJ/RimL family protein N-acetyltransferase [Stackebrandtia albiflava]